MAAKKDSTFDSLMSVLGGSNDDFNDSASGFLDTGFKPLNKALSGKFDGGIPRGRIIEMFGPSSSGKTAMSTQLMIETQRQGGIAIFLDHERTFDPFLAKRMGLNVEAPYFIYKKPKTWEESNTMAMKAAEVIRKNKLIPKEAPILVVFDSVAAMIPQSVFAKGIDEYNMNDTTALARVTSTTLKAVNQVVEELNMTALYLNQIRTKPGVMFGDPTTTPGGGAMEFFATIRISLSRKQNKKDGKLLGQTVTAKIVKNKLTMPFQEAKWYFEFDETGFATFDVVGSSLLYLIDNGLIEKSGNYIVWDGKKYYATKLTEHIKSTEGEYEKLMALFDS